MTRLTKITLSVVIIYIVCLIVLGFAVRRSAPPTGQILNGIAISSGTPRDWILISGKRMQCVENEDTTQPSVCTITLGGKELELTATRTPLEPPDPKKNRPGSQGDCTATYEGQTWACWQGSPVIGVDHFAYLDIPLGLSADQLAEIRRTHFIENLPEMRWLQGSALVAVLNAVVVSLGIIALFGRMKRLNQYIRFVGMTGLPILLAIGTFWSSLFFVMYTSRGLWD